MMKPVPIVLLNAGASLALSDGTATQPYDLVVGADGVKSTVRAAVLGGGTGAGSKPQYSDIRISYGVTAKSARKRPGEVRAGVRTQRGQSRGAGGSRVAPCVFSCHLVSPPCDALLLPGGLPAERCTRGVALSWANDSHMIGFPSAQHHNNGTTAQRHNKQVEQWFSDALYCIVFTAGRGAGARDVVAVCQRDTAVTDENHAWSANEARATGHHHMPCRQASCTHKRHWSASRDSHRLAAFCLAPPQIKAKTVEQLRGCRMPAGVVELAENGAPPDNLFLMIILLLLMNLSSVRAPLFADVCCCLCFFVSAERFFDIGIHSHTPMRRWRDEQGAARTHHTCDPPPTRYPPRYPSPYPSPHPRAHHLHSTDEAASPLFPRAHAGCPPGRRVPRDAAVPRAGGQPGDAGRGLPRAEAQPGARRGALGRGTGLGSSGGERKRRASLVSSLVACEPTNSILRHHTRAAQVGAGYPTQKAALDAYEAARKPYTSQTMARKARDAAQPGRARPAELLLLASAAGSSGRKENAARSPRAKHA